VLAFTSPTIADTVHLFQKDSVADMNMGGLRALALSGNPFFDLSAAYGLIYIYYFKYIIDEKQSRLNIKDTLLFAILFVGTFFAGRTGFVGLIIGLFFYFFAPGSLKLKTLSVLKIIAIFTGLAFLILMILPGEVREMVETRLLPFAFEFIYAYTDSGSITTKSSDSLSQMYFPLSVQTFFLGDGRYIMPNGDYYRFTDAGYMRNVLYYGIAGPILLFIYQMQFFRKPIKIIIGKFSLYRKQAFSDLFFFLILIIYVLILHYKGEALGFLGNIQVIFLLTCISYYNTNNRVNQEGLMTGE
jgi:hypothetical protein